MFDSSGGFILPDNNLKVPDVSFVRAQRLKKSVRYFGELTPDLVVEIKSQSDRIKPLKEKIKKYLELGAQVGILIDTDQEIVVVFSPDKISHIGTSFEPGNQTRPIDDPEAVPEPGSLLGLFFLGGLGIFSRLKRIFQ
ncbi:Uma2 family endonuclease [Okeania sp. SIO3I5]|uniref:Uma2 family endonuclease n=1 Tax=Okeania sp. SIO3I5 TaxID=2607805 RepID=UPI0025E2274F|nr:Uma2 family endonuclease [Okeania sp. SIO3I5]